MSMKNTAVARWNNCDPVERNALESVASTLEANALEFADGVASLYGTLCASAASLTEYQLQALAMEALTTALRNRSIDQLSEVAVNTLGGEALLGLRESPGIEIALLTTLRDAPIQPLYPPEGVILPRTAAAIAKRRAAGTGYTNPLDVATAAVQRLAGDPTLAPGAGVDLSEEG